MTRDTTTTTTTIIIIIIQEIEKVDQKTRKFLIIEVISHLMTDVTRLYIKRRNGGSGLVELQPTYNDATVGLSKYFKQGKDGLTRLVQEYDVR